MGQRGPAFLDLQIITGTDVERASFFFTAYAAGYVTGSLAAGVIYDLLAVGKSGLLFLLSVAGLGACTIALPWCSPYWLMIAINFVAAVFGGAVDTAGNAELLRLWGKGGEMAMQFLHFTFAFGGVIGPLVTEPFLTPTPEVHDGSVLTNTTITNITTAAPSQSPLASNSVGRSLWNVTSSVPPDCALMVNSTAPAPLPLTTNVHYAFLIAGGVILLITVPLTAQLFSDRSRTTKQRRCRRQDCAGVGGKDEERKESRTTKQPLPLALFLFVQGTLCLFFLLHYSGEDTTFSFLATFVVKQLGWTKSRGARLSALFWAMYASFRFLGIFLVHVLSSAKLLTLSCVSLVLAQSALLLCSSRRGFDAGVWVSTLCVGASMAAIFPTSITWMEDELVRVTGRVMSTIFVSGSLGAMVSPVLVGYLMQEVSPMWYAYLVVLLSSLSLAVLLFLLAFSRLYLVRRGGGRHRGKLRRSETTMTTQDDEDVVLSLERDSAGGMNS